MYERFGKTYTLAATHLKQQHMAHFFAAVVVVVVVDAVFFFKVQSIRFVGNCQLE